MLEFSLATKAGNLERRCLKACIGSPAVIHEVQILISTLMGAGCRLWSAGLGQTFMWTCQLCVSWTTCCLYVHKHLKPAGFSHKDEILGQIWFLYYMTYSCWLDLLFCFFQDSLDSYYETEFWYVDRGIAVAEKNNWVNSLNPSLQRQEDKWWLPTPKVPANGLSENSRKRLHHHRDATSQILKAATAINTQILSEMEVPAIYLNSLPKVTIIYISVWTTLGGLCIFLIEELWSLDLWSETLNLLTRYLTRSIQLSFRWRVLWYLWRSWTFTSPYLQV